MEWWVQGAALIAIKQKNGKIPPLFFYSMGSSRVMTDMLFQAEAGFSGRKCYILLSHASPLSGRLLFCNGYGVL